MYSFPFLRTFCLGLLWFSGPFFLKSFPASPQPFSAYPISKASFFLRPTYITTTTLNLYQNQSVNAPVILQIPEGAAVEVIDSHFGNWWMIRYKERTGFTQSNYLKYSVVNNNLDYDPIVNISSLYNKKPSFTLRSDLDLHERASTTSAILTKLPEGVKVKVIDSGAVNWWMVHFQGRTGYIQNQYLSNRAPNRTDHQATQNRYSLIKATSLRVSADSGSRVLLRFAPGDRVNILDRSGEWWWKVSFNGKLGWVLKKHLLEEN